MKTRPRFFSLCASLLGAACTLTISGATANAVLIAGWDFQGTTDPSGPIGTINAMPPSTPRDFTANAGAFQSISHLYLDGTNGSSSFFVGTANADTEIGALNGISANSDGTNFVTSGANGSLAFFNRAALGGIDNKSAVFKISMDGYEALQFSFAVQRPAATDGDYGVSLFTFAYSLDGATFLPWGAIDTGAGLSVINGAFTLSPVLNAVNDADTVYVKMTISGSTGGDNSTRIDNVQFNAQVVPEPSIATALLGGLGLLISRRARRLP